MSIVIFYLLLLLSRFKVNCVVINKDTNNFKGYFWHITDLHLDSKYDCDGKLGNYQCDSPMELIESAMGAIKKFHSEPDFVIWTGDSGSHRDNLTLHDTWTEVSDLTKRISETFQSSRIPLVPVLGNHDVFPANSMASNSSDNLPMCEKLSNLWSKWLDKPLNTSSSPPFANFARACYTSQVLHSPKQIDQPKGAKLLLLSLNGLVWYIDNPEAKPLASDTLETYDPYGQFEWLEKSLQWASDNEYKVITANHFPIGSSVNSPRDIHHLNDLATKKLYSLYRRYGKVISANIVAHEHVDSFRMIYDESNTVPMSSLLLGPSLTPFHLDGLGAMNPRLRLYEYSRVDGRVLNYQQFKFDLSNVSKGWHHDYNAASSYGLKDLSPKELDGLLSRFNETSNNLWQAYYSRELGGRPHENYPLCPSVKHKCGCDHICAMKFLIYSNQNDCLDTCSDHYTLGTNNNPTTSRTSIPFIVAVLVAFLIILVGIILLVNRHFCSEKSRLVVFTPRTHNILRPGNSDSAYNVNGLFNSGLITIPSGDVNEEKINNAKNYHPVDLYHQQEAFDKGSEDMLL